MDAALSHRPRVVILAYPTNDTAQGYAVEETVRNLLDMRAMALERGAQVIVLSTQPRNLDVEKRRKLLEINARLQSVVTKCFVNVHSPLADKEDLLARIYNSGDGVHPSAQGHVLISTLIGWLIDTNTCTRLQK
jgi:lysophospholipase L1-like esterase